MGAIGGEELKKLEKEQKAQMAGAREERILVGVRLRPLSDKEIEANEVADWECINENSILYRNTLREGSTFPSAYTFGQQIPSVFVFWLQSNGFCCIKLVITDSSNSIC